MRLWWRFHDRSDDPPQFHLQVWKPARWHPPFPKSPPLVLFLPSQSPWKSLGHSWSWRRNLRSSWPQVAISSEWPYKPSHQERQVVPGGLWGTAPPRFQGEAGQNHESLRVAYWPSIVNHLYILYIIQGQCIWNLCVKLSIDLSVVYLSFYLPTYLPIYLSTYLPIYLSIYLCIFLSI